MELAISNLIKIILGMLVIVAVVIGLYIFFKDSVFEFFKTENSIKIIFSMLK